MDELKKLMQEVNAFSEERDWDQFHSPVNLAKSIAIEAAELLELFQWSGADTSVRDKLPEVKDELADTLIYCIMMALNLNLDIDEIIKAKMRKNKEKYPSNKVFGSRKKYTEYKRKIQ